MNISETSYEAKKEYYEYNKERIIHNQSLFDIVINDVNEKNTTLIWGATIIIALFIYYCQYLMRLDATLTFYLFLVTITLFFLYISFYIIFRVKMINVHLNIRAVKKELDNLLMDYHCELRYYKIKDNENDKDIAKIFSDRMIRLATEDTLDNNKGLNKRTDKIYKNCESMDRYFEYNLYIILIFITLLIVHLICK
jgi:hypothetical protein